MLDWDPKGKQGPATPLPDLVTIHTPKDEEEYTRPPLTMAPELEVPWHNLLNGSWATLFICLVLLVFCPIFDKLILITRVLM